MLELIYQHFLLLSLLFFAIGYLTAFIIHSNKYTEKQYKNESFFSQQKNKQKIKKNIDIDDSTHVVTIKTDGLEKRYEEIGTNLTKQENITSSINKLKNLKKE